VVHAVTVPKINLSALMFYVMRDAKAVEAVMNERLVSPLISDRQLQIIGTLHYTDVFEGIVYRHALVGSQRLEQNFCSDFPMFNNL
jgi:hypothetical protein